MAALWHPAIEGPAWGGGLALVYGACAAASGEPVLLAYAAACLAAAAAAVAIERRCLFPAPEAV